MNGAATGLVLARTPLASIDWRIPSGALRLAALHSSCAPSLAASPPIALYSSTRFSARTSHVETSEPRAVCNVRCALPVRPYMTRYRAGADRDTDQHDGRHSAPCCVERDDAAKQ